MVALGSKARWEMDCIDCQGPQRQAGPVSHGRAFSPLDGSRPFPRGSQAAHPASVNTGPSVSFPVTHPPPHHGSKKDDCGACVCVCVSHLDRALTLVLILIIVD